MGGGSIYLWNFGGCCCVFSVFIFAAFGLYAWDAWGRRSRKQRQGQRDGALGEENATSAAPAAGDEFAPRPKEAEDESD